ncbi:hypothetical protein Droror1_Dr00008144 [Drosera rotundifolia]
MSATFQAFPPPNPPPSAVVYPTTITTAGQSSTSHSNGSFAVVFIVLAVIIVVSGLACVLGRIFSKKYQKTSQVQGTTKNNKSHNHNQKQDKLNKSHSSNGFRAKDRDLEFGFRSKEGDIELGFERRVQTGKAAGVKGDRRGNGQGAEHIVRGENMHMGDV